MLVSQHAFSQAEGLDASLPAISYAESWLIVATVHDHGAPGDRHCDRGLCCRWRSDGGAGPLRDGQGFPGDPPSDRRHRGPCSSPRLRHRGRGRSGILAEIHFVADIGCVRGRIGGDGQAAVRSRGEVDPMIFARGLGSRGQLSLPTWMLTLAAAPLWFFRSSRCGLGGCPELRETNSSDFSGEWWRPGGSSRGVRRRGVTGSGSGGTSGSRTRLASPV